jgi:hypothetical protein
MKLKLPERRRFIRVETPLEIVVCSEGRENALVVKNISPVGFMIETAEALVEGQTYPFLIKIGQERASIGVEGKVIWQKKISLEDRAPFDAGVEMLTIDDLGKNDFLKYLCDLLYDSEYKERT